MSIGSKASRLADLGRSDSPPLEVGGSGEKVVRRRWMHVDEHRDGVRLGKDISVGMEFVNGYLGESLLPAHRLDQRSEC